MKDKTNTYVFYLDDGSKTEFEGTRSEALEEFTNNTKAAFFVLKSEDPNFIWKNGTWRIQKENE